MSVFTRRLTPRHPLAQCAIDQIERLELRPQHIVAQMGYQPKNVIQACDRLRHVLCSPTLGLDNSYYDARYSAADFLVSLFTLLAIPPEQYQAEVEKIQADIEAYDQRPRYNLRASIKFDFSNTRNNWLTLMSVARYYEIFLPTGFYQLPDREQQQHIQQGITAHYQQYHDNLPYSGVIEGYVLLIERNGEVERREYGLPSDN